MIRLWKRFQPLPLLLPRILHQDWLAAVVEVRVAAPMAMEGLEVMGKTVGLAVRRPPPTGRALLANQRC